MRLSTLLPLLLLASLPSCSGDDRHEERLQAAGRNPSLQELLKVADAEAGRRKFSQCLACHTITQNGPDTGGPNLYGVFGKAFGENRRSRYAYTAALIDAAGKWDAPTLDAWIAAPDKVVPGTKMQIAGISDPLDRADVIVYIRQQGKR